MINFLHLGIQEYFAAKYVTTLPENEVYTLLKESFIVTQEKFKDPNPDSKSVRLSNMWILYCGITSGQCKILRHYLTIYGKLTMYNPSMVLPHCSHDYTLASPIQRYFTTTISKQVNSNIDSQVISEMTDPSQQGSSSDQRISNTGTISQDVLKGPVKVLYLFQCF